MLVGIGQDSHRFDTVQKDLVLGGKTIFGHQGLKGNSDADVVYHAICNAISSVSGLGSLSTYSDQLCKSGVTDSSKYVEYAVKELHKKKLKVNNISISVEAKTPRIEPHLADMKKNISKLLKISKDKVGITATSGEELTAFGRGEGIQAICLVSVR